MVLFVKLYAKSELSASFSSIKVITLFSIMQSFTIKQPA